jgi:hypothetical protein
VHPHVGVRLYSEEELIVSSLTRDKHTVVVHVEALGPRIEHGVPHFEKRAGAADEIGPSESLMLRVVKIPIKEAYPLRHGQIPAASACCSSSAAASGRRIITISTSSDQY